MSKGTTSRGAPAEAVSNRLSNAAIQLGFEDSIRTGANGSPTPPLPSHGEGSGSTTVTGNPDTVPTPSRPRKTYPRNWSAYNASQTSEKADFMELLADLCASIEQPEYSFGRRPLPISDMLYLAALKVYCNLPARRFASEVKDAYVQDFITVRPSFNSIIRYISDSSLTPLITDRIEESGASLRGEESRFAADSSGFSTYRFDRWRDTKRGKGSPHDKWLKGHIMVGTRTKIIATVVVTAADVPDWTMLPVLLDRAARRFEMTEVLADSRYLSDDNPRIAETYGARLLLPSKSNSRDKDSPILSHRNAYSTPDEEASGAHYRRRAIVETVFSTINGKFGDSVRAKSESGQVNEILLKCLCHNLCVVARSKHQFGIVPSFTGQK